MTFHYCRQFDPNAVHERMSDGLELRVKRLSPVAVVPTRSYHGDAGWDLFAAETVVIASGKWATIATGVAIELPPGTEGQIRPRSGLASENGIFVLNSPGTVDEGYRGEIKVILANLGAKPFRVTTGVRIAQLVVQRRLQIEILEVDRLSESCRGEFGFGSTGM